MPDLPADLHALLDRVAEDAARSCGADDALVWLIDGAEIHRVAHFGDLEPAAATTLVLAQTSPNGLRGAAAARRSFHVADAAQLAPHDSLHRSYAERGIRTILSTPVLDRDRALGVIMIRPGSQAVHRRTDRAARPPRRSCRTC